VESIYEGMEFISYRLTGFLLLNKDIQIGAGSKAMLL